MSASPISPAVTKGAIVGVFPGDQRNTVVVFQYNPESLTRTLQARTAGGEGQGPLRLAGPPEESIKLAVQVDATDQLERGDATAASMGVYPALAALEMLLYPRSTAVVENDKLASSGVVEVIPPEGPLTVLVWGRRRIVPVRITEFSITEEAFDTDLNPVRAKVDLGLKVLTYDDLGTSSPGGALFMAHQAAMEAMATIGGSGTLSPEASAGLPL